MSFSKNLTLKINWSAEAGNLIHRRIV